MRFALAGRSASALALAVAVAVAGSACVGATSAAVAPVGFLSALSELNPGQADP